MKQLVYQVCYTRYHVSFYLWLIGSVLKYCKVLKYYEQDWIYCLAHSPYPKSSLHYLRLQFLIAVFYPKTPFYPLIIYHPFSHKYPKGLYYPRTILYPKYPHYPITIYHSFFYKYPNSLYYPKILPHPIYTFYATWSFHPVTLYYLINIFYRKFTLYLIIIYHAFLLNILNAFTILKPRYLFYPMII